jgi:hypothetical protein
MKRTWRLPLTLCGLGVGVVVLSAATGEILLPAALVVTLLVGAVRIGITQNKADSAHSRITALDTQIGKSLSDLDHKLDRVSRMVERIDERTGG